MEKIKKMVDTNEASEIPVILLMSVWAPNYYGIDYSKIIKNPKHIAQAQIRAFETIGLDALYAYCDIVYLAEAFGCAVKVTQAGAAVESHLEINNLRDIDKLYTPDVRNDGRLPVILEATEMLADYAKGGVPVIGQVLGPFTTLSMLMDPEKLMKKIIKDRPLVEKMLNKVLEISVEFGQALVERGVNLIQIGDPSSSSNLISPIIFNELVFPSLCNLLKSLNVISMLHICGDTNEILKNMSKTGAHIISVDQCIDLRSARERIGEDVCLGGNISPNTLLFGNSSDVAKETERCLSQGGNKKFVLMSGCSVMPGTPVENLKAILSVVKSSSFRD